MRTYGLALLALAVAVPSLAVARTIHLACHDGVPPPRTLCVASCSRPYRCDVDAACDGRPSTLPVTSASPATSPRR